MKSIRLALLITMLALLGACAGFRAPSIATGTSSADVRARLGAPTDERTLTGGVRAWDYVQGPLGFTTWRMVFDSGDRVSKVEQLLSNRNFRSLQAGTSTKAEVMGALGRPGEVSSFPNLREEVWTYRFMDGSIYMLSEVHLDAGTGLVKYVTSYPDPAYYSSHST